ncbi:glycoside hydrolase family 32 protein [Streptomyces sp. NPDC006393]|uniref:glycoside hydrolase family 32 protein n=1 Tax=Streptomyces sp. NPDC006393 TaxID=3156763 RepID=UPI0033C43E7B
MSTAARDPHLPAYHLRPPRNWVNDPNGLVFHDGHYHVYFQYNPYSARHEAMHWGHFRSADLVHWQLLPPALAPTPGGLDADGVWSGNAVTAPDGDLIAFYSARRSDRWYQPIAAARSRDGGTTFAKRAQPLIDGPPAAATMFRDPYVWRDGERWRMLVGAALADGRGAALQYESEDLDTWTYRGPLLARPPQPLPGGRDTGRGWECAQYAPFADRRGALLVSAWDPDDGAQCAVAWSGHEEDGTFAADHPQLLDHGPDFYAPALLPAPDGRILMWAWIWEARDEPRVGAPGEWIDSAGWAGMLSTPRELTLGDDGVLRQRPAAEIDELRGARRIRARGKAPSVLGSIGRAADLTVTLPAEGGLRISTSADAAEFLAFARDRETGDVLVSRDHASLDHRAKRGAWRLPARPGPVDLRILLDHSVAEVFTADGQALTLRFYPVGGTAAWRVAVTGSGRHSVDAWDVDATALKDKRRTPEHPTPQTEALS